MSEGFSSSFIGDVIAGALSTLLATFLLFVIRAIINRLKRVDKEEEERIFSSLPNRVTFPILGIVGTGIVFLVIFLWVELVLWVSTFVGFWIALIVVMLFPMGIIYWTKTKN